jgi:transposase InsO family protein
VGNLLGLLGRTLKDWQREWEANRLRLCPLGSPGTPISPAQRAAVERQILLAGPAIGCKALNRLFPELPRRSLLEILIQVRDNVHEQARTRSYHHLLWFKPGRVWAIDYTEPHGNPVDGDKRWILTVRDLASGCILLFVAVEHADAATTIFHLTRLFQRFDAPLVLKADNGCHFIADDVSALLQKHGVTPLFSPIHTPKYNGSVEADQGSLKARADQIAAIDGSPNDWTSSHLDGARDWRNRTQQTGLNHDLPTPEERFAKRSAITAHERSHFQWLVQQELQLIASAAQRDLRERQARAAAQDQQPDLAASAGDDSLPSDALHRRAVAAAMSAAHLFTTRRRLVRLPDPRGNRV